MSLRWALICSALLCASAASAQDKGTLNPRPLPPLAHPDDPSTPAKALFGRASKPASLADTDDRLLFARLPGRRSGSAGQRSRLAGDRLSRNRNWGHPALIAFLERFAHVPRVSHWPGILVGDMSQPRGGPMITGHASIRSASMWIFG